MTFVIFAYKMHLNVPECIRTPIIRESRRDYEGNGKGAREMLRFLDGLRVVDAHFEIMACRGNGKGTTEGA
jgi:hypothetical protein